MSKTVEPQLPERYKFARLLSKNHYTRTVLAKDQNSGTLVVIKSPSHNSSIPVKAINGIMRRSYSLQKRLHARGILRASTEITHRRDCLLIYPVKDLEDYEALPSSDFQQNSNQILCEIAVVVDYLHASNLVHNDLKLEQFLWSRERREIVLADLETLTKSGTSLDGLLVGTPEYMSPESMESAEAASTKDLFSLGASLKAVLHELAADSTNESRYTSLCDSLTKDSPGERPSSMSSVMYSCGLVDDEKSQEINRRVLSLILLDKLWHGRRMVSDESVNLVPEFLMSANLFGIDRDYCSVLERVCRIRLHCAIDEFANLLKQCEITRLDEYWFLSADDETYLRAFASLESKLAVESKRIDNNVNPSDLEETCWPRLRKYLAARDELAASLAKKRSIEPTKVISRCRELATEANSLSRAQDALDLYQRAWSTAETHDQTSAGLCEDLAHAMFVCNKAEEGLELITTYLSANPHNADNETVLNLMRLKGWALRRLTRYEEASAILDDVTIQAQSRGYVHLEVKAMYDRAQLYRNSGNTSEAISLYRACLERAIEERLVEVSSIAAISYISLLFDNGRITESLTICKKLVKEGDEKGGEFYLPYLYRNTAMCHGRLGNPKKARYWLGRFYDSIVTTATPYLLGSYFLTSSLTKVEGSLLSAAIEDLHVARESLQRYPDLVESGVVHQIYSYIALYQGDEIECKEQSSIAKSFFSRLNDAGNVAESELAPIMSAADLSRSGSFQHLVKSFNQLSEHHNVYYAHFALLYLLLTETGENLVSVHLMARRYSDQSDLEDPIMSAVRLLADCSQWVDWGEENIVALKIVYRKLHAAHKDYFAMITCERIARVYQKHGRPKMSNRFLDEGIKYARSLSNHVWEQRLEGQKSKHDQVSYERGIMLRSHLEIASILDGMSDPEESLNRIVRYAADMTEAERAVLLLKSGNSGALLVRSSVNTDTHSLEDIALFSNNITKETYEGDAAAVIEDALEDKRTRQFESIVKHNIRSVICVPIKSKGKTIGTLYLDNHTISSLFDKDDIEFVASLAGIIGGLVSAVQVLQVERFGSSSMKRKLKELGASTEFVTCSKSLDSLLGRIEQFAVSDALILVTGESGCGKEIICDTLQMLSNRKDKPYIKVNCTALSESLVESELFGIADGTATGVKGRPGLFESANGGTILIDEIGDMPFELQSKLLRVVEKQEFYRVGSFKPVRTDVRLLFATNTDLAALVNEGKFRKDLFHRINVLSLEIVPLRNRPEDVELLVSHFADMFADKHGRRVLISSETLCLLEGYSWPGNVRELRNLVERLSILGPGETISPSLLPPEILHHEQDTIDNPNALERARIARALKKYSWNQSRASAELCIPLSTLRRRIKKYKISDSRY